MPAARSYLEEIAAPVLASDAFRRLGNATFLDILSPRYNNIPAYPLSRSFSRMDGSRADHSIEVAGLALKMAEALMLSPTAKRYAAAWALTHDLATWPLSHTGDAAFCQSTNLSLRKLRQGMIEGAHWLPRRLAVRRELDDIGVDPGALLALMSKDSSGLDAELEAVWKIIHSPITPDSLEGMERSGSTFGVQVPKAKLAIDAMYRDVFTDVLIDRRKSKSIVGFWRSKAQIYDGYINHWRSIEFESAWSRAIIDRYWNLSIVDSLEASEWDLLSGVLSSGTPRFREIKRYKCPLAYHISPEFSGRSQLSRNVKIEELNNILIKSQIAA